MNKKLKQWIEITKEPVNTLHKSAGKKPNIAYVWQIADLRAQKKVLYKILSGNRLQRNFNTQIAFSMMETIFFLIPSTIEECKIKFWQVQATIKSLEKDADQKREQELKGIMEEASQSKQKQVAEEIKYKLKAEGTKKMFRKIRRCCGSANSGSVFFFDTIVIVGLVLVV